MFRAFLVFLVVVLLLTVALRMRTVRFADAVEISGPRGSFLVMTTPGGVRVSWPSPERVNWDEVRWRALFSSTRRNSDALCWLVPPPDSWARSLFEHQTVTTLTPTFQFISFAFWPISVIAGIPLLFVLLQSLHRKAKRRRGGLCGRCGYDLRATPLKCPECGATAGRISSPRQTIRRFAGATVVMLILAIMLQILATHDFRNPSPQSLEFRTLSAFDFDDEHGSIGDVPASIRQLDGKRISINGFMIPLDQTGRMTKFALVPTLNFGGVNSPPPRISETIVVRVITDECVSYSSEGIRVCGTLHVASVHEDGYLVTIFRIDADEVAPSKVEPPT